MLNIWIKYEESGRRHESNLPIKYHSSKFCGFEEDFSFFLDGCRVLLRG